MSSLTHQAVHDDESEVRLVGNVQNPGHHFSEVVVDARIEIIVDHVQAKRVKSGDGKWDGRERGREYQGTSEEHEG